MTIRFDKAPLRAAAYVAALAVVLVAALGLGRLVGPVDVAASPTHPAEDRHADGEHTEGDVSTAATGLVQELDGYSLELAETRFAPGEQALSFTVAGPDGEPVTDYDEAHERDLHLIAVRRDLTGFQHLHPTLDPSSGEWSTTVVLDPGSWRVLVDFVPAGGEQVVLGADLVTEGAATTASLGKDVSVASVNGYEVDLEVAPAAGEEAPVVATVRRDGVPVTDLGRYLGELGHLVVLRDGDLAYIHGHPGEAGGVGPAIPFDVTFPTAGRYRLFLEFEHAGEVHAVAFTLTVSTVSTVSTVGADDEH